MSKLTERQEWLLKMSIEEYVRTGEAIASTHLETMVDCKWSAPLLRIELRKLEEIGLLQKFESSRGRIPTSKGYEYYTNNLLIKDEDNDFSDMKDKIKVLLKDRTQSINEVIKKTCDILSEATDLTTISKEGDFSSKVVLSDILSYEIGEDKINAVFVYSNGEIKNKVIDLKDINIKDLTTSLGIFAERLKGSPVSELKVKASTMKEIVSKEVKGLESKFNKLVEKLFENIVLAETRSGVGNIVKYNEFKNKDKLEQLINIIEDNSIWDVIALKGNNKEGKTTVSVGLLDNELEKVSVINRELEINNKRHSIALIGPSRIDYNKVVTILDWLGDELKKF